MFGQTHLMSVCFSYSPEIPKHPLPHSFRNNLLLGNFNDKENLSAVSMYTKLSHSDTNLPNSSFCIHLRLRKLLAKGFHSRKSWRISSDRRHFEIVQCTRPQSSFTEPRDVMIYQFYQQNTNGDISQFIYHFQDRLLFFYRIDKCDLCERVWFIVRLNVTKISPDIAWFSKRNLQRARLGTSAKREYDSQQNPMCGGTFGWFGICHWYWCK